MDYVEPGQVCNRETRGQADACWQVPPLIISLNSEYAHSGGRGGGDKEDGGDIDL